MPSIMKPLIPQLQQETNALGLTLRDYEGAMSTLCAGCGHDSITASIVHAIYELALPPHMIAKLSGIGCSSKATAYFDRYGHGLNSTHGEITSIRANPGCSSPAFKRGTRCALSPEKPRATNVAPRLRAIMAGSIGGSIFGSPFLDFEFKSAEAENCPLVSP